MVHLDAVVLCESFGDPERTRCRRLGPIPRTELDRAEPLHIPHMKKLVGGSAESAIVCRAIGKNARLDDLRGEEVLHTVARTIIGCEMKEKCITIEFRRPPHSNLCTHNFFDVPHESWPVARLVAT